MKTAVIISEYNPFHNGHKYQIDALRDMLGEVCIIAVMSGSFTQRGDVTIIPKYERARAAVECGASLVLELPFPYSCNSAEYFARAGVSIADSLGIVDYICFGSESGDISMLQTVSDRVFSDDFRARLFAMQKLEENASLGRAALTTKLYECLYTEKDHIASLSRPNDILAVEYLNSLKALGSEIRPLPVLRLGADHNSKKTAAAGQLNSEIASAGSLRSIINSEGIEGIKSYVPKEAYPIYLECSRSGRIADVGMLTQAVLSFFRLAPPDEISQNAEITGGLNHRLCSAAAKARSLDEFFSLAHTKRYTGARIRRAVWNCMLGVSEAQLKTPPAYTQVLAADSIGRQALRKIKKLSRIPVLTKPSSYKSLQGTAYQQAESVRRADALYTLSMKKIHPAFEFITQTPYFQL